MSTEFAASTKAITEEARQKGRVLRQGNHAIAYVARWKHLQLFAQTPGTATVVGNCNYCRKVFEPDFGVATVADQLLEPGKQRRKAGATADCHKVKPAIGANCLQVYESPDFDFPK